MEDLKLSSSCSGGAKRCRSELANEANQERLGHGCSKTYKKICLDSKEAKGRNPAVVSTRARFADDEEVHGGNSDGEDCAEDWRGKCALLVSRLMRHGKVGQNTVPAVSVVVGVQQMQPLVQW